MRILFSLCLGILLGCSSPKQEAGKQSFPAELTQFVPYQGNPVFSGTDTNTWDRHIRERGWIMKEDSVFHMWYTGYVEENSEKHLGYASSPDGLHWTRYPGNPIYDKGWVEDMCIIHSDSTYYMFSEGRGDTAHMLISKDRIHWTEKGNLDIRKSNGQPIAPGPYGTPTVIQKDGTWYLFYERDDLGIWLAGSKDLKVWTNVQDGPVISMGPDAYDRFAVAMDQVIQYEGRYYGYYHASAFKDWREWTTDIAVSDDLVHWTKYPGNPILKENKSSGILVSDGRRYLLYSMHDKVQVHFPANDSLPPR